MHCERTVAAPHPRTRFPIANVCARFKSWRNLRGATIDQPVRGTRMNIQLRRTTAALAVGIALCAVAGISACRSDIDNSDAKAATAPAARVAAAHRGDISHVLTLAGQFQP